MQFSSGIKLFVSFFHRPLLIGELCQKKTVYFLSILDLLHSRHLGLLETKNCGLNSITKNEMKEKNAIDMVSGYLFPVFLSLCDFCFSGKL